MSGYVASARIVRAAARLARAGGAIDLSEALPARIADPPAIVETGVARAPAPGPTLAERGDAFRERWAQLTFFLLDGESWRS